MMAESEGEESDEDMDPFQKLGKMADEEAQREREAQEETRKEKKRKRKEGKGQGDATSTGEKKSKKKKLEQTEPPTIGLSKLFPDGKFPEGELQEYKNECVSISSISHSHAEENARH